MEAEFRSSIIMSERMSEYDEYAKKIIAHKIILAYILVKSVKEFSGMNPKEVVPFIEGDPIISKVYVDPGLTNMSDSSSIIGLNTENSELGEGLARFDLLFYVRMCDGLHQIIVNIELQKNLPVAYKILNRAQFYGSRMISSQKNRDFVKSNYDDIKQTYTIWICMNMPEHSMNYYHLVNEKILGNYEWEGKDIVNIVLIGLGKTLPEQSEKYELHRLLYTLLSKELVAIDKLKIIENEYEMTEETDILRKDVECMCNLSEGLVEDAMERGYKKGMALGISQGISQGILQGISQIVANMHKNNFTLEQIALAVDMPCEEIQTILQETGCN